MRNKVIYDILLLCCVTLSTIGCVYDDLPMIDDQPIGDGESRVSFNVSYRPLEAAALGGTRSVAGDKIAAIEDVFVLWYKADSTLAGSKYLSKGELDINELPRGTEGEKTTQHAEFTCDIPYGEYRIYAVVNMGDLSGDQRIKFETDFKAIELKWKQDDIPSNRQMSGYFTLSNVSYVKKEADLLKINRPNLVLHSWVRRAASKVTVAFDASKLNENIYIYIKSAQIMDIPLTCPLVNDNTPVKDEQLLHEGDTILYGDGGDDYNNWLRLSCGRGANKYGDHENDARSLFFYENMQGQHRNKHQYQNFERKDSIQYGTYIEVKGFYKNNSATSPSYGDITYRCMLGKDMVKDFNAERNCHYKLTLVFKNDANDPDWHIVYDYEPTPPEIVVPNPMYISYLSNKNVKIPVTVYYGPGVSVTSIDAEITKNDWGYTGHPYLHTNKELYNGFLSLELIDKTGVTDRQKEYEDSKTFTTPKKKDDEAYLFEIPVYTRPMNLNNGFSGNNYYVGRRRYAKVKLTAHLQYVEGYLGPKKDTICAEVDVIQVRRLVNPKGIWRKGDSMKPFRVNLKNSDSEPTVATKFDDVVSDGPWSAYVLKGNDWIQLKDAEGSESDWGVDTVKGGTGSKVEFDYRPGSTYTNGSRFGLIEIKFHNNTCSHIICVSQGLGTVTLDNRKWHMTNVKYNGVDESNPLLEGSMFKFGTSTVAFLASNNLKTGYGPFEDAYDSTFDTYGNTPTIVKKVFKDVKCDQTGFTSNTMTENKKVRVANQADWETLTNVDKYDRYYGVLYGEECGKTLSSNSVTNTYTEEGQERGMRGCFVCEKSTGKHLFFPIGNTGHGRRQDIDHSPTESWASTRRGVLKYADRSDEMPSGTAVTIPCLYELYREPGAVYWFGEKGPGGKFGFDINYMTFGFNVYNTTHVYNDGRSDACFIRRIDN